MEIYNLLEQKAFDELNAAEQAFVLEQMSSEAYDYERSIILASQDFWELESAQIQPAPPHPNRALAALKAKKYKETQTPKGIIAALLAYKIPAWQAAAALIFVFFFVRGLGTAQQNQTIIVAEEHLRDTVFVKEYITKVKELPADTLIKVIYKEARPKENRNENVLASNKQSPAPNKNVKPRGQAIVQEFDDVLQYCNTASSSPASKDTFLQILSNEVFF